MRSEILSLKRPERVTFDVTLKDRSNPGVTFTLHLKQLTAAEFMAAQMDAQRFVVEYVTGWPLDKDGTPKVSDKDYRPPTPLPAIDGQAVTITENALELLAVVHAAQAGEDLFSIEELIGLSTVDGYFSGLVDAHRQATRNIGANQVEDEPDPKAEPSADSSLAQ